jgi:hypothetical protein
MSGIKDGEIYVATVISYNKNGTMRVTSPIGPLDVAVPNSWISPEGEFAGGFPKSGTSVKITKSRDRWHCLGYDTTSKNLFVNNSTSTTSSLNSNNLRDFKPDRYLIKAKRNTRLFVEPGGISAGNANHSFDISNSIVRNNFKQELSFTDSYRKVSGTVKRDLGFSSNRNLLNSTLNSIDYESSLIPIGMDPSSTVNKENTSSDPRNPTLAESREVFYEFTYDYNFKSYQQELSNYQIGLDSDDEKSVLELTDSKSDNRAVPLSLSLERPNNLIESIKGTVVDSFGNILDINRSILPIGKIDEVSLKRNNDKSSAYKNILRELRKSIAYHFEINARKDIGDGLEPPSPLKDEETLSTDYYRDRSRFFVDIDKEGQFKINIPASSETGNVPLLTRYENYTTFASKENPEILTDQFIKPDDSKDIYLDSFAGYSNIKLSGTKDELDGYQAPTDRFTDEPIKYGTAFHDITRTCNEFLKTANYIEGGEDLIFFDADQRLNKIWEPLDQIVSDTIIVTGADANGGGRSGMINLDGFISINVGANTVDRQSIWLDTAGGIVQNVGRDKNGISHAASFDGKVYWQIGGSGIGNSFDTRFATENDAYADGELDIRVQVGGHLAIFRIGPDGIWIVSPGTINLVSDQHIYLKAKANILMEAESIVMYGGTEKRIVSRFPKDTQIT